MALNATEIAFLARLIAQSADSLGRRPRLLSLGYPDILALPESLEQAGVRVSWSALAKRKRPARTWANHGRSHLADHEMIDAHSLFSELGADATVSDFVRHGSEDITLDLNFQSPDGGKKFDLIVDPGTLEHCFNIGQAFDNVDRLLAPLGFAYHQAAIAFPNHGFWSISPTAFYDFYDSRGYELGIGYAWSGGRDPEGFIVGLEPLDPFGPLPSGISGQHIIGSYAFRKPADNALKQLFGRGHARYPTQRCYRRRSRLRPKPRLRDFLLPPKP